MYTALWILLAVAGVCCLFLWMPVRIRVFFSHRGGVTEKVVYAGLGALQINLTHILRHKKKAEPKGDAPPKKMTFSDVENAFLKGIGVLRYLKKRFCVKLFSLKMRMGLGDAADTGIATGAAYGTLYSLLGMVDRYFILKKHEVSITPVFAGVGLEVEFRGTFQLRLCYLLGLIQKIRKEDVK